MISKELKEIELKEKNLDKALEILKPYKEEKWDEEIIKHLQNVVPKDEVPIDSFSYLRPTKK